MQATASPDRQRQSVVPAAATAATAASVDHAHEEALERILLRTRVASLVGVLLPFAGFVVAVVLLWGWGFGWLYGGLLLGMYVLSAIGITVGYHRYFTHRSFQAPRAVQAVLATLGSMALEGPVLKWVAMHRRHHQHSDRPGDPHSPHDEEHGQGMLGVLKGFWHAHVGWIFQGDPKQLARYVPDLAGDRLARFMSRSWVAWAVAGAVIPAALAGLLTGTWTGALLGFLWGGLARIFLVHHVTWSVNSVCHLWGTRPFRSHDHSRNNAIFGVLAMGEGWHNNHHAFPSSARHGLRWWEFDASYWVIRGLAALGLAWDVKTPAPERLEAQRASG